MRIFKNNALLADNIVIANTFWSKFRGKLLINTPLLLNNCNSIHTIFNIKPIDVIFLDKNNKVIKLYEKLPPRCIIFPVFDAQKGLEFDADFIKNAKIKIGEILVLEK